MIHTYHRPESLEEALSLLDAGDATVLGGGTSLVAAGADGAVVDLQALGLDGIELDGDRISIGAMARLRELVDSDLVPALLRDLARREAPSTIRNAATIGGAVASGDPESELVAGLLVHEAEITTVTGDGPSTRPLSDSLGSKPEGIITSVTVATEGITAASRTGRTPADRPIVMVAARRVDGSTIIAMTGISDTPVVVDPAALETADPPGDFRGTAEYRKHLARTLTARVIAELDT